MSVSKYIFDPADLPPVVKYERLFDNLPKLEEYTANTGRRDVAYTTRRDVANRTRCDVAGRFRTRARSNDWSGANNSYWSGVGAGCSGHHTTYHSGVDTTDRGIRDASEYLTFNSAHDGDDHSARHNIFCSILT